MLWKCKLELYYTKLYKFSNHLGDMRSSQNESTYSFKGTSYMFSNVTNCKIQQMCMLIAFKISQVSFARFTSNWNNYHPDRKFIVCILPLITCVQTIECLVSIWVSDKHKLQMEVCLILPWLRLQVKAEYFKVCAHGYYQKE